MITTSIYAIAPRVDTSSSASYNETVAPYNVFSFYYPIKQHMSVFTKVDLPISTTPEPVKSLIMTSLRVRCAPFRGLFGR